MDIPEKVTPEEASALLDRIRAEVGGDNEAAHSYADDVLCALLRLYGQDEIVQKFDAIERWYA